MPDSNERRRERMAVKRANYNKQLRQLENCVLNLGLQIHERQLRMRHASKQIKLLRKRIDIANG